MASLLGAADLTWMQATQNSALPGTIVIQRMSGSADGMGGYNETWAAVGTVIGRIYPINSRAQSEDETGGQVVSLTRWFATVPVGTDVTAKDRLLSSSRTWEVTEVNNDESYQTAVRCQVIAYNEEQRT